jgi:hypothetical protein
MQSESDMCRGERVRSRAAPTKGRAKTVTAPLALAFTSIVLALSACGGGHAAGPPMSMRHAHGAQTMTPDGEPTAPCPMHKEHGEHCPMRQRPDGGVSAAHPDGHGPTHMMADGGMMPGSRHGGYAP